MPFCLCHSWGSMPAVLEKWKELSSHWVFTRVREIYTSFSKPLQASHSPDLPFIFFFDRLLFAPIGSAVCQLECSLNLIVFINAQGTRLLMSSQLPCQWNAESPGNAALLGAVRQVKQWRWPGPFWGAPKPVCCSGGSQAGGFHSYCYGAGRVVNRVAQVEMSQTLVLLLKFSSFSWVNSPQIVVSLWLISSVLKSWFRSFCQHFHGFYGGQGLWRSCLPQVVSFYVVVASLFLAKWHWGSIISQSNQFR